MADEVLAKNAAKKYTQHPEGSFMAVCVDVVNLGEKVDSWQGTTKLSPKIALVFQVEQKRDDGAPFEFSEEFTLSMGDKSNLRKFLSAWRGKPYTDEQANEGVPIHKLVGQPILLTLAHEKAKNGNTYVNIVSGVKPPFGLTAPTLPHYVRNERWAKKREAYAQAVAAYKASVYGDQPEDQRVDHDDGFDPIPPEDDSLPF